jgi:hypothetical protein
MPKLGEILISMGACTPTQIKEALENQVIFGGRLGTNLLELRSVTEPVLAKALGQRHGLPSMHGEMAIPPAVTALLTPAKVDQYEVIPYQLDGRKLKLLVCDPGDFRALDEVAFVTGTNIVPVVVPEARLWLLMRNHYGIERQLRGIEVKFDGPGMKPRVPTAAAIGGATDLEEAALEELVPLSAEPEELMSEEAFDAIYQSKPGSGAPAQARAPQTPPPTSPAPQAVPPTHPSLQAPRPPATASPSAPVQVAPAAVPPPPPPAPAAPPAPVVAAPPPPPTPPPPPPEPTPLVFADAVRELGGVGDRDSIARTVLRYARSRFKRAVLLTVQPRSAQGWEGMGGNLTPQGVRRIRIDLGGASVFQTVINSRAHYLGPLQKTEGNLRFLKALQGGAPKNCFLIPILALGRVVNVLYADNGRGQLVDPDVGELLILASKIAQSYDTLVMRAAR